LRQPSANDDDDDQISTHVIGPTDAVDHQLKLGGVY
jgi:hypothetical protein